MANEKNLAEMVGRFVDKKVTGLISDLNKNQPSFGILARGVGKHPGNVPAIWEFTLKEAPEEFYGETEEPTRAEWAVHIAMTLFGLHQYGKDKTMHISGRSLGTAAGLLAKREKEMERTLKMHFDAIVISEGQDIADNLSWLIKKLRNDNIPLDYAHLAADLFEFQDPDLRQDIRLSWGMDYAK